MDKVHIVITGRRNTGKSSLVNAILGQSKAIVSDTPGTTTDPVKKSYEIPGVASVIFVDTAGIDDKGTLGTLRIEKTLEAIQQADAGILVITHNRFGKYEKELTRKFQTGKQPFLIVHNQSDLQPLSTELENFLTTQYNVPVIRFSAYESRSDTLIKAISRIIPAAGQKSLLNGLTQPGDMVMLVTPIDSEAPTGRLILPQVQMLRTILDRQCISLVMQPQQIESYFTRSSLRPDLVITDSQAFREVAALIPPEIPLTSFSIVLAHGKGNFEKYLEGTPAIDKLRDGDRILLLESCSHHVSCEDIGRIKIPALLQRYTGKHLNFDFVAGSGTPQSPWSDYALIIQCGGCMMTTRQLHCHLQPAINAGIPVSNYGMTLAYIQGIFERVTAPFRKK